MQPSWVLTYFETWKLQDETSFFQFGQSDEISFTKLNYFETKPSSLTSWPTLENPRNTYKIGSIWLEMSPHVFVIERQTYSFLEWLGDIGGLFDALKIIGAVLTGPFAAFNLKVELLTEYFRFTPKSPHKKDLSDDESLATDMEWNFNNQKRIERQSFMKYAFPCLKEKHARYKKMLQTAESRIEKELDLGKFVRGKRI